MANAVAKSKSLPLYLYWKNAENHAKDALAKIDFLKNFRTKSNLTIIQYPSSFPFSTLRTLCHGLALTKSLDDVHALILPSRNGHFVLARNGSESHTHYEEIQRLSGGISSEEITDLGEFRIVQLTEEGDIVEGADFSLFRIHE